MSSPPSIRLADYKAPAFQIDQVDLHFDLTADATIVTAKYTVSFDGEGPNTLTLNGEDQPNTDKKIQELLVLKINGQQSNAQPENGDIVLEELPRSVEVEVQTKINPAKNLELSGLYVSGGHLCTQCEAMGFRRIIFFPDRPDIMTKITTTLEADKATYPVLLSNGNPGVVEEIDGGRHRITWADPKPKPSYLFALVAGDLGHIADTFTTSEGRTVDLRIYTDKGSEDRCHHAMASLKKAMQWDEDRFNRAYDMDVFNIVSVADFNSGAMENTTLNIFNSSLVLAEPAKATDANYFSIEGVIAHEFFHHWTGNRVTLNNWFQLTLKEGLTVMRDQYFSQDMHSRAVCRVDDVNQLRNFQFPEDAGAMAHPIRPTEYVDMDNFYTTTVYEKGAEIIWMYFTILGAETFHKAMDLYFERHEDSAVDCEAFLAAMADASGVDLAQFKLWYSQSGTPTVKASGCYNVDAKTYELTLTQSRACTKGQDTAPPLHIPVRLGLIGEEGAEILTDVVHLKKESQTFTFTDMPSRPVPSLFQNFSAPVKLESDLSDTDFRFLMIHDTDPFNQWEAAQTLATKELLQQIENAQSGKDLSFNEDLMAAYHAVLQNTALEEAFRARMIVLPSEKELAQKMAVVDTDAIHQARTFARQQLAAHLKDDLQAIVDKHDYEKEYVFDAAHMGQRSLAGTSLRYLCEIPDQAIIQRAYDQYQKASNMTDRMSALGALDALAVPERQQALDHFYTTFKDDNLVIDKWFALQAMSDHPDTLDVVQKLKSHPDFTLKNPNRVRALIGVFAGNQVVFHRADGQGYKFLADTVIELDQINAKVAARLLTPFLQLKRFGSDRQALMKAQVTRIQAAAATSKTVGEIIGKVLSV